MIAFIYIPICLYLNIKDVAANYGITGIYIPICLYLNKGGEIVDKTIDRIYIPICLYLNRPSDMTEAKRDFYLHSNMSLFKSRCPKCKEYFDPHLHSNMSLFKSITRIPAFFLPYSSTFCRPAKVYKYFTISPSLILRNRSKIVYLSCLQNSVDVRAFLHYRRATV